MAIQNGHGVRALRSMILLVIINRIVIILYIYHDKLEYYLIMYIPSI
jgi:hypothetical protein